MDSPIISVEKLGKRYRLRHQAKVPYTTFRDAIAQGTRRLFASKPHNGAESPPEEDFWALKDVSFEIERGNVVGIIGRNGAGKSTLLKVLSRITEPTTGRVRLRGRVASLLEVGTGFHPELSGRENIFLNGAILGMSKAEIRSKFDEIVAFAEVERFLDTPVKHYSSGMYVRLAFAVAAHLEPEILIVDEVLAVGDSQFQNKCLGKIKDVASYQGRTVIFVSHQMNAVESLCNRCVMLQGGTVVADSRDVRSVVQSYLSADSQATELKWTRQTARHDNPYFAPRSMEITNTVGDASPYSRQTQLSVVIAADVEVNDSALTIGYDLYNENNDLVYRTYQTDGAEDTWPRIDSGFNVLESPIPMWLNEGRYRLCLRGGLHNRIWLFAESTDVPAVEFEIRGRLSESPYWQARRDGLVAPVVQWRKAAK
jgi:lipopolysaccharide transport system ATP-binding protein